MGYKDPVRQRKYQNEWMQRRRQAWLAANGPCVQCESNNDLEIDHIDPKQKVSHRVWSWSKERRDKELAKCQVLCHKCHKKRTIKQLTKTTHGRLWMYIKGCRCAECKLVKAASDKKYKDKKYGRLTEK